MTLSLTSIEGVVLWVEEGSVVDGAEVECQIELLVGVLGEAGGFQAVQVRAAHNVGGLGVRAGWVHHLGAGEGGGKNEWND